MLPGDLYFYGTPATHVGIVLGAGMVIDASFSAGKVVERQLWATQNVTFGRVPRPGAVAVTGRRPTTAAAHHAPTTRPPLQPPQPPLRPLRQ